METTFDLEGSFPCGRVGEWLKPADCKSAAPCGLRRFESFPVHQALVCGDNRKPQGNRIQRCSSAVQFGAQAPLRDRKSTRLNSSHLGISYAVFCLKKK